MMFESLPLKTLKDEIKSIHLEGDNKSIEVKLF